MMTMDLLLALLLLAATASVVFARWRRRHPEPPAPVNRAPSPRARVSGKYEVLHTYLDRRYAQTVVLTFEQVEALLGFPLPDVARTDRVWWNPANVSAPEERYWDAWTLAGRTAEPNLLARNVVFERGA